MSVLPKGVLSHERGIQQKEGIFFYNASDFAKQNFFYLMWGGKYLCLPPYKVHRQEENTFDSFVLFYIEQGSMEFQYKDQIFIAHEDDVILLDCKEPHRYTALERVAFYWFHLNGQIVKAYCDLLYNQKGAHFPAQKHTKKYFLSIQKLLAEQINQDNQASVLIHQIFASLSGDSTKNLSGPVLQAKEYLDSHFLDDITVDDIAAQAALSRYHFSRLFHSETGLSPYAYLIDLRMDYAKHLLTETQFSIEEIADRCNFCSTSNLIRLFKQQNGITPAKFRKLFH